MGNLELSLVFFLYYVSFYCFSVFSLNFVNPTSSLCGAEVVVSTWDFNMPTQD